MRTSIVASVFRDIEVRNSDAHAPPPAWHASSILLQRYFFVHYGHGFMGCIFFLLETKVLSEVQERFPDAKSLKRQVGAYDVPPDRSLCPTTT